MSREIVILFVDRYPLYPTTNLNAFRYGFYLLNRNIGQVNIISEDFSMNNKN